MTIHAQRPQDPDTVRIPVQAGPPAPPRPGHPTGPQGAQQGAPQGSQRPSGPFAPPPFAPQAPQYPQAPQAPRPAQSNGLATAGFVVALIGAILAIVPILGIVAWVVSPVGLVLSIVGLVLASSRGGAGRGLSIAGIVLGALGLVLCFLWVAGLAAASSNPPSTTYSAPTYPSVEAPAVSPSAGGSGPLTLEVTGDLATASVTHTNETGGIATSQEALPFRVEVGDPGGYSMTSLSASRDFSSGGSGTGTITCRITQNGQVLSTQTATGDYPSVFCAG